MAYTARSLLRIIPAFIGLLLILGGVLSFDGIEVTRKTKKRVAFIEVPLLGRFQINEIKNKTYNISPMIAPGAIAVGLILVVLAANTRNK